MKYKLIQKVNPNNREEAPLWYATPITGEAEEADSATRAATANTTGEMGDLRITFRSKGVADINEFNPNTMIYEARLRFVPKRAFRNAIIQQLTFENAGVLADGIDYASLAAYRKAKGLPSGGGEEEGGEEEFPLG